MPQEIDIRGVFNPASTPADVAETQAGLFDALRRGELRPVVGQAVALADAPRAHVEVMAPASGGSTGNIVLLVE
jgi:NADPH:quinone reductase-like Zn-dependent oxidoreductase